MVDREIEGVRLVRDTDPVPLEQRRVQRSEAQRTQDEVLDKATEHAEAALEHVNQALDWLSVVTSPKNRNVPVYVNQLVEEISETKRIKK